MLNPTWWLQIWPLPNICSDSVTLRERATLPHPGIRMMATVVCNYPWPRWIVTTATDYQTEPDQTQSWGKPRRNGSWTNFAPTNQCSVREERWWQIEKIALTFLLSFILCSLLFLLRDIWRCFSCGWEQKGQAVILWEGIVHPKMKILSLITRTHVVPKDLRSSLEHK